MNAELYYEGIGLDVETLEYRQRQQTRGPWSTSADAAETDVGITNGGNVYKYKIRSFPTVWVVKIETASSSHHLTNNYQRSFRLPVCLRPLLGQPASQDNEKI